MNNWDLILKEEFNKEYFVELMSFLKEQYSNDIIYPKYENIFNAFKLTDYQDVKVVILGQDPYHGENEAHGLSFSVEKGVKRPPSLNNMFKELYTDLNITRTNNNLTDWANQGILLLNTVLTVKKDTAFSHRKKGWEIFTDEVIKRLNEKEEMVIFVLWGNAAKSKKQLIDLSKHKIVEGVHPSPLSASRGFFGSKPYSTINNILKDNNIKQINWGEVNE